MGLFFKRKQTKSLLDILGQVSSNIGRLSSSLTLACSRSADEDHPNIQEPPIYEQNHSNGLKYLRYFQKWDDSYNKELGYEWFKICIQRSDFPIYNSMGARLSTIRRALKILQTEAASHVGISASTLSLYENDHTYPPQQIIEAFANYYSVSTFFLTSGYCNSLELSEHIKMCLRFGETDYIDSLRISAMAASSLFPEMLSLEDRDACILVNDLLQLDLDLFNEQAKAAETLRTEIKNKIVKQLQENDAIQSDLYSALGENRYVAQSIIKELCNNGTISKEKQGKSFILRLTKVPNH